MAGLEKDTAFFHTFQTQLDHKKWNFARTTYIIFTWGKQEYSILKNENGIHAEVKLIDRLSGLSAEEPVRVYVYMNNSPCYECAQLLLEFLLRNRHVSIFIYASNLFNINRRSCMLRAEWHKVEESVSKKNCKGLRDLHDHRRCVIKVFDKKAWENLEGILRIPIQNFDEYYNEKRGDRSREEEDGLLKSDLNYICQEDEYIEEVFSDMFHPCSERYICVIMVSTGEEEIERNITNEGNCALVLKNILINRDKDKMRTDLKERLEKLYMSQKTREIIWMNVYMNYFPSQKCAESIIEFLSRKRQTALRIRTTYINPSADYFHHIRRLKDHGRCQFMVFNDKSDWLNLIKIIGIQREDFDQEYRFQNKISGWSRLNEDTKNENILKSICDNKL